MLFVEWAWGRREEVAGGFADVDEGCRFGVANVGPEVARRERFADGDRHAAHEVCESGDAAGAVVQGHAVVPSVASWSWDLTEDAATMGGLDEESGIREWAGFGEASGSAGGNIIRCSDLKGGCFGRVNYLV